MNRVAYLEKLRAALQYDSLVNCIYTHAQRRAVHREIAAVMSGEKRQVIPLIAFPEDLPVRSACRINTDRQSEWYDPQAQRWVAIEPLKKQDDDCEHRVCRGPC